MSAKRARWGRISAALFSGGAAAFLGTRGVRAQVPPDPVVLTNPTYSTDSVTRQAITFQTSSNPVALTMISGTSLLSLSNGALNVIGTNNASITAGTITSTSPVTDPCVTVTDAELTISSAIL